MEKLEISVDARTDTGKQAAKKIRGEGYIPAVIYGKDINTAVNIPSDSFKILRDIHFSESTVINLTINVLWGLFLNFSDEIRQNSVPCSLRSQCHS
jgi:ribosomal protein L25 (general stress protein Ctc)